MSTSMLFQSLGIRQVKVQKTEFSRGRPYLKARSRDGCSNAPAAEAERSSSSAVDSQYQTSTYRKKPTILKLKTHRVKCGNCG